MVNFRDPTVALLDAWALAKLYHALDSLYLWEFLVTLEYEWSVFRGHRPYRWTIWIYSLTRIATLVAVILNIVGLDATAKIDCQLWITVELAFGYLAFVTASLLMVLRVIAIWNKNRIVVVLAVGVWMINIGFLIQGTARLVSVWNPMQKRCVVDNTESNKPNIIVTLITDIILLLIMLVGLLRIRRQGGGAFGLGQRLWKQGVIWLFLATFAEVTPVVFISLDLNDSFNLMFQVPSMITMSIAATRMYRCLSDFGSDSTEVFLDDPQRSDRTVLRSKNTTHVSSPPIQMEVVMQTV